MKASLTFPSVRLRFGAGRPEATIQGPIDMNPPLKTTVFKIKGIPFTLEIAESSEERRIGLMNRESVEPNGGMIFILPEGLPIDSGFHMNHCLVPLDILFVGIDGKITQLNHKAEPCPDAGSPTYMNRGGYATYYVIELLGGTARKNDIKVGDEIQGLDQVPGPVANQ